MNKPKIIANLPLAICFIYIRTTMNLNEKAKQLKKLAALIEDYCTGPPDHLAQRVGISRSKLFDLLEDIKMLSVEVAYSRDSESYYYSGNSQLSVVIPVNVVKRE